MKTTKVIFLDIDGVFTSLRSGWYNWDIYAVNFIIWICKKANVSLVISSSWRLQNDKEFFDKIFPNCIHDDWCTPKKLTSTRGQEIDMWLQSHKEITDYLILDDMNDISKEQYNHFIMTDEENGLNHIHLKKIKAYFNLQDEYPDYYNCKPTQFHIHKNMFDQTMIIKNLKLK